MSAARRSRDSFASTSFLDIIACGFGAIVLLVLLSKDDPEPSVHDASAATEQLNSLVEARAKHDEAMSRIREIREEIAKQEFRIEVSSEVIEQAGDDLGDIDREIGEHRSRVAALKESVDKAGRTKPPAPAPEIENVGGIPVDRKYIIFVVDTSGSMQLIWPRVLEQVDSLMDVHPRMEGFQVMNDSGIHLISAYARKWIPDSPSRRASILRAMQGWIEMSGSDPVPGIKVALRFYSRYRKDLSIYVLGDEFSGNSYDAALDEIAELNTDPLTKEIQARIHGIGFYNPLSPVNDRYSILMREVARLNGGAFVAVAE
ncbi:MAG: VWA domain-containing protein [Gammaproteobacteria bacterium]|nr:VWA domain-containing protein [Gammaproteobacteria bacterium]MYD75649.1 VWA domain-containing protein [Gammaproteobacteria bacterium]MYJ52254.1 VWA domain-containing protein [Gammaproteobacteria bacterium]